MNFAPTVSTTEASGNRDDPGVVEFEANRLTHRAGVVPFRLQLEGGGRAWNLEMSSGNLKPVARVLDAGVGLEPLRQIRRSVNGGAESELVVENRLDRAVRLFWVDSAGKRHPYGVIRPGDKRAQHTFAGHVWVLTDFEGVDLGAFAAGASSEAAVLHEGTPRPTARRRPTPSVDDTAVPSPDRSLEAFVREDQLWIRGLNGPVERPLTIVGTSSDSFHKDAVRARAMGMNYDLKTGRLKNPITRGNWVVRGVDRVDEKSRQIWFRVMGYYPDHDPYYVHHFRVGFDGTGLVALTEADGTHSIQWSPDRTRIIDTWSRVDQPPVHDLRDAETGRQLCRLETADASDVQAGGRVYPERFVALGRDGKTRIYGIIHRPTQFNPSVRYPVVENIYAGPHGQHVP